MMKHRIVPIDPEGFGWHFTRYSINMRPNMYIGSCETDLYMLLLYIKKRYAQDNIPLKNIQTLGRTLIVELDGLIDEQGLQSKSRWAGLVNEVGMLTCGGSIPDILAPMSSLCKEFACILTDKDLNPLGAVFNAGDEVLHEYYREDRADFHEGKTFIYWTPRDGTYLVVRLPLDLYVASHGPYFATPPGTYNFIRPEEGETSLVEEWNPILVQKVLDLKV